MGLLYLYLYLSERVSEGDLPQTVKFIKSALQLRHSLEFSKLRGTLLRVQTQSEYNELPAGAAYATVRVLLAEVSCDIKYTTFYKLIMNFIITVCIHYKKNNT